MYLSMWMIYDWLKPYDPKSGIVHGQRLLHNIRLFSDERRISRNTVYISGNEAGGCILVNGKDLISVDCDDTDLILNEVLDAFEFYNEWEAALNRAIETGCSADELLEFGKGLFPEKLLLADASFRVYANSDTDTDAADLSSAELPLEALIAVNAQQNVRVQGVFPYIVPIPGYDETVTACNLFISGRHVGWLIARGSRDEMSHGEREILGVLGRFAEKWISEDKKSAEHLEQSAPFLDILNDTFKERAQIEKALKTLGWNEGDKKQVYYFLSENTSENSMRALDKSLDRLDSNAFFFYFENNPVLICNCALCNQADLEKNLLKLLKLTNTTAGKSPEFSDIFTLPENYRAALISAKYSSSALPGCIAEFSGAVLPYISFVLKSSSRVDVIHPALLHLSRYDLQHKGELYNTLKVFLENESSCTAAACALNIHRSTLIYRLERIVQITGIDLEDEKERLHLEISFLINEN